MSMFGGGNKQSSNKTTISNDNRQTDATVNANQSSVVTAGAGTLNYTDSAGSVSAGKNSTINISSVDPNSYQFASTVVDRAFASVAASQQAAAGQTASIGETVAKLAQGTPLGVDWKRWLVPAGAVVAIVIGLVFLRRKG